MSKLAEEMASTSVNVDVVDVITSTIQDGYEDFGIDFESFKEATEKMSEITHLLSVKESSQCKLLSVCRAERFQKKGYYAFYIWDALNIERVDEMFSGEEKPKIGYRSIQSIPEVLYEEMERTSQLALVYDGQFYLMSDLAIPTFSIRASVSGDKTINKSSLTRNMHLAEGWFSKTEETQFVVRESVEETESGPQKISKIFAALGGRYTEEKQTILAEIVENLAKEEMLGKLEVRTWQQDHRFTSIWVEFPEAAEDIKAAYKLPEKIVPGIYLATSDVGASSLICRGVYRIGSYNSFVTLNEVKKAHSGKLSVSSFVEEVDKTIFSKLRKFPEVFASLFEDVIDYSRTDLTSEAGQQLNKEKVSSIYKTVAEKTVKKVLGGKRIDEFVKALCAEINPTLHYTYYDLAIILLEVPERVEGLDAYSLSVLQKDCNQVPFVMQDIMRGKISLSESIYLAP